eukprot:TRINITY_DN30465_c0_g1_i1.p2 TRINITY_DN30465_c0_g1~~TRINITY_DN30465_c0_g1_i1.p2  ORF type:complete len:100 (-),score=7.38 TRINITY_DN30465_c0_g1_i1:245-544(-)
MPQMHVSRARDDTCLDLSRKCSYVRAGGIVRIVFKHWNDLLDPGTIPRAFRIWSTPLGLFKEWDAVQLLLAELQQQSKLALCRHTLQLPLHLGLVRAGE